MIWIFWHLFQTTLPQAAITADYTIVILVGIIGALLLAMAWMVSRWLISTLKEIKQEIKDNRSDYLDQIAKLQAVQVEHTHQLSVLNDKLEDGPRLAEELIQKIRAITPPGESMRDEVERIKRRGK